MLGHGVKPKEKQNAIMSKQTVFTDISFMKCFRARVVIYFTKW